MEQSLKMLREKAMSYTEEAYGEHGQEIFEAMRIICDYAKTARMSGLLALEEMIPLSLKERKVPLPDLLLCSVDHVTGVWDLDLLAEEFEKQMEQNGHSGYEWYVAYVYLKGLRDLVVEADPETVRSNLHVMVPERWLEDYDRYWKPFDRKGREEELAEDREMVEINFKMVRSVWSAFHRIYGQMEPEKIRRVAGELDARMLAAGLALAEEEVRERILEHLTEHQQELVIEEWSLGLGDYTLENMAGAMDRMLAVSGLTGR